VLASSTIMFLVGLADDKLRLRPSTKLIAQGVAAAVAVSLGVVYPLTPWPVVNVLATVFWFLALTNALNLLDNMDGVAAGVGAIAAAFLAATFLVEGQWALAAVCLALAGAAFGYLPYNFNPASIFMGDSGSLFMGSLLAGLGAAYPTTASGSIVSVLFVPALIVIIPILDTLLVTITRTLAGRSISVGGRDHTSHRLVAMGLSQRQTALLLYAFAALGGVAAMLLRDLRPEMGLIVGAVFLVVLLVFAAYLGGLHTYADEGHVPRRATLLITDLLHKRRAAEVLLDLVLFALAYQGAYLVRYDGAPPPGQAELFAATLAVAVVCKSVAFGILGVYRGSWRHVTVQDVLRLGQATLLGSLLTVASLVFFFREADFARGILVVDALLAGLLAVTVRASFRSLELVRYSLDLSGAPALVYGAGRGGELAVRELRGNAELRLRPVAFLDDDPTKARRLIHGVPVLGGEEDVVRAVRETGARTLILGTRKLSAARAARLRDECRALNVELVELRVEFHRVLAADGAAPVPAPAPVPARARAPLPSAAMTPAAPERG
jgi:UDP-GlcNAc:undecaprenyl-phosphate GlcNAc-1-phosphate transferase